MKLVTFRTGGQLRPGILNGHTVIDIRNCPVGDAAPAGRQGDILSILQGGGKALEHLRGVEREARRDDSRLRAANAILDLKDVTLAAPLPNPRMVLSIGANYREHLAEMNTPVPQTPLSFQKSLSSIIATNEPIVLPAGHPDMVDWEGEFSAVIGKPCHRVNARDALDHVAGYTIINDVSARDWVAPALAATGMMNTILAWEHNILGKLYPTFCPMGPVIVTADEIADPENLHLETRLNGKVMQSANTADLVFSVARIIEYYSQFYPFEPGDIITTGSPSGVGFGRKPPVFMKPGDRIEVEVEGIGILSNPVVAGKLGAAGQ